MALVIEHFGLINNPWGHRMTKEDFKVLFQTNWDDIFPNFQHTFDRSTEDSIFQIVSTHLFVF